MKCVPLALVLLCALFIVFSGPVQAQVSFFQPPTFPDCSRANLFVADFNGDGKPDLLCSDGTLSLGNGDGTFQPSMQVPIDSPQSIAGAVVAVADFNGDGKPDVLEPGANGTLLVLLGNGDGSFQSAISSPVGAPLLQVAAADLNGDGKADVVGLYNGTLYVCISNGDGTFKAGVPYSLGVAVLGGSPTLTIGDFNGDGKPDIAVYTGDQVVVFLGNGDGTFQSPKTSVGPSNFLFNTVAGDFNGDGKLDLAIGSDTLYILLGNGDGTFQAAQAAIPNIVSTFVAADLNGDGKLDLVFATTDTVAQVYLGNGDGSFSEGSNYVTAVLSSASGYSTTIAAADFNLDGKLDIATGGGMLLGNGDGTLQGIPLALPLPILSVNQIGAIVIGDFENNGKPDIAALSSALLSSPPNSLSILRNNGSNAPLLIYTYPLPEPSNLAYTTIVMGDLNGDGNLDLIVLGATLISDFEYSVLLGNGDGSFQAPVSYTSSMEESLGTIGAIIDVNNDHIPDLLVLGSALSVFLGNGDGTFAAPVSYFAGGGPGLAQSALLIGDFNGDGKVDVAVPNSGEEASGTFMLYGNGDGTFQAVVIPPAFTSFTAHLAGDLRNNGRVDLVSNNQVALNNGDGTFTFLPVLPYYPYAIADMNGDGKLDLFANNLQGPGMQTGIALGNGDGTFGSLMDLPALVGGFAVADMNSDGRPDIVYPWSTGIAVLLNTTPPSLGLSATVFTPSPVTAGNSANSTVTAVPMFGFNGTEALSCTGLPSGASCIFNPPTISGSSNTSTLTITTSASVAAGTYPVEIQGTAGSTVNSVATSLVVQVAPGFSIGAASGSPTSQTITAGQTASFNVALAAIGSFSGTVNLSCAITLAGTPAHTCILSSSSVQISSGATQTVTVEVATFAPVTSATVPHRAFPTGPLPLAWTLMFVVSAWLWVRNRKRLSAFAVPIVVLALALSVGCGGSGSSSTTQTATGTPAGTYTATVTATSGSTSHSMALQVVVQ
jgi:FG-GAP-like repeat